MSYLEYIRKLVAEQPPRRVELSTVTRMVFRQPTVHILVFMGVIFAVGSSVAIASGQMKFRGDFEALVGCATIGAALIALPFFLIFRDLQFLRRGLLTEVRFMAPLPSEEKRVDVEYFVMGQRFTRKMVYDPSFYRSESGPVRVIALPESGRILTFLQLSECTR